MARKRTSPIWKIDNHILSSLVKGSISLGRILAHFGLQNKGNNPRTLKRRLIEENIDFSHIPLGINSNKGRKFPKSAKPLCEILVEGSSYNRYYLKQRLIKDDLIPYKCALCASGNKWQGRELKLALDHINGISNDNRLENLRFLCPNCHSQTDNFAGRNRKIKIIRNNCERCGKVISKAARMCCQCRGFLNRKVDRPSIHQINNELKTMSFRAVGRKYNVSDNTVRKWLGRK